MRKRTSRIYWLTFARFVLGRRSLTVDEVNKAINEKGVPTPYFNLPELVTAMGYRHEKDPRELFNACLQARITPQRASAVAGTYEDLMLNHTVKVLPGHYIDYSHEQGSFHVPLRFDSYWVIDDNPCWLKYIFPGTPEFAPGVEEIEVLLATAVMYIPAYLRSLGDPRQLPVFDDAHDVPEPSDIDYWALKFQGFDAGIYKIGSKTVEDLRPLITQTANRLDELTNRAREAIQGAETQESDDSLFAT